MLGRRLHECHLGVAILSTLLAGWAAGLFVLEPVFDVVAALGLWLLIKDWRDLSPRTRDTATWRLGIHRRALALRAARRADSLPRVLAGATALVGVVNIVSALTRNTHWRTHVLEGISLGNLVPFFHTLALPTGALLVVLATYIAKRRHRAWSIAVVVLAAIGLVNIFKGLDFEEALAGWAVAGLLWWGRDAFYVRHEPGTLRSAIWGVPAIAIGTIAVAASAMWAGATEGTSTGKTWNATVNALLLQHTHLHLRNDFHWIPVAIGLLSVAALVAVAYMVFRPIAAPRSLPDREIRRAAADVVSSYGTDSLSAFKLRSDLQYLFCPGGRAFAAYRVEAGVMLLAGDPVGPEDALPELLREIVAFAESRGLKVAVIGAGEQLLPLYEQAGLRAFYIGDESVVETGSFSLEGRAIRKVRQAVSRVERAGYRPELQRSASSMRRRSRSSNRSPVPGARVSPSGASRWRWTRCAGEHLGDSVVVLARDGDGRDPRIPSFRPGLRPRRDVALVHAPRARHAQRPHRVPRGEVDRAPARPRHRAVAQLRRLRAGDPRPAGLLDRLFGRIAGCRPVLPDREPLPLQRQVLTAMGASLSPLRGRAGLPRAGLAAMWAEGQIPKLRVRRTSDRIAA